jgi:RNA polymerase sigma-70 factor (ECF subfamily)
MTAEPPDLSRFWPALLLWAKCQMPAWLRGKLTPDDLVQQTLAEALAAPEKLAGRPDPEALGYLRRALANNLIDAARKHGRARADVSPDDFAQSSVRLADWLAADHTSPSERAARNERFERLASALAELPDAQRVAVEMRYLQKLKLAEIARLMNRTEGAVSQLLHRAVTVLRDVLTDATL